jgi:quercetin dioxygenase-like cupin family protein
MRRLCLVHGVLTAVLFVGWVAAGVLYATGNLRIRWHEGNGRGGGDSDGSPRRPVEQPAVPEDLDGKAPFYHERNARPHANSSYPEWLRGTAEGGWADARSRYRYTLLVGPRKAGLHANGLLMGTLFLERETTYPAHSHPAAEIYYVLEGEADWWVDGVKRKVVPGTVILHKPNAVHGWRTTSAKPLKAVWFWWAEGGVTPAVLDQGASLTDPDLAAREATALPFAARAPPDKKR